MLKKILLAATLWVGAACFAPPAQAALLNLHVEIAGNTATAEIEVLGLETELILTFDNATNLTVANLNLRAQILNPLLDFSLIRRILSLNLTSITLPIIVTIEPRTTGGFALNNTVRVELHTDLLPYTAGSSFRLFKAPLGGAFRDITDEVAPGSVRTRGTTGGFSQFLILLDLRPTHLVVDQKLAYLRTEANKLSVSTRAPIVALIDSAEDAVDDARYADAIASLDALRAHVSANAGGSIPNTWTPLVQNNNVAGELLSGAATAKFSIGYLRDYGN